jgi:hypothetical protein
MTESHKDGVQLILPDGSSLNDRINTMLKPDKSLTGNYYISQYCVSGSGNGSILMLKVIL